MMDIRTASVGTIGGIVLAGGLSSRMGQDKALLSWDGETLLERSIRLLRESGAAPIRVSGPYAMFDGIPDRVERCGPLGGLYSVLSTLEDGWAWVLPVDMPRLEVGDLHRLRDAMLVSCARFIGQPLPMLLNVDPNCRTLVARLVQQGSGPRSLWRLQQELGVHEVPIAAEAFARMVNCNTPGQWKDAVT